MELLSGLALTTEPILKILFGLFSDIFLDRSVFGQICQTLLVDWGYELGRVF